MTKDVPTMQDAITRIRLETKKFLRFICEKNDIDYNDKKAIKDMLSIVLKVKNRQTILDYLDGDSSKIPQNGYVFLATFKDKDGIVRLGEVYDSKYELLNTFSFD